ncbi:hypothetical protein D3C86_1218100 [compost metagenome]
MQIVVPRIKLGNRLIQIKIQNPREILRVQVMLHIQHQPPINAPRTADLNHARQRRQLQPGTDRRRRRLQTRRNHLSGWHPPLGANHRVKVTALHQVVSQARRRYEPAPALLAINLPLRFQLQQRLTHSDPRCAKQLTELALGRQFAARRQQPVVELFLKHLANRCHRFCSLIAHQRYLSGLDQHCFGAEPR